MNKDVIYIDIEDDITAIIGKIKNSREKIVALVPPKRIGALQSAVNLRLLARMADDNQKRLVIITNNQALIALSAAAKIPIAKNLQSKPEMAEISALDIDDGEDVIDGSSLPIGEHAETVDIKINDSQAQVEDAIEDIDIEADKPLNQKDSKSEKSSLVKVPNFSNFRKLFFIGLTFGVLIISFLVWAIWYAPAAKVIITAKTSPAPVSVALTLGGTSPTDLSKNTIQTITKQIKRDASVDFDATGTATLGDKASGVMTLSNADSSDPISVPVASVFSNGVYNFVTKTAVMVPGAAVVDGEIVAGGIDVEVEAGQVGSEYNLSPRAYVSSVAGLTAYGGQMNGGSSHEAKVVTAKDIQKANQALADLPTDDIKQELLDQFTNGEVAIDDSFIVVRAAAVSSPLVDAEAKTGKAKLTASTTYSITAIAKSELEVYLNNSINKQISNVTTQKIYNNGIDTVILSGYLKTDKTTTINMASVGQIGPNIDQATLKDQVKGKRYGDIQSMIGNINGVSNVDIKFSYFWVTTVPDDNNKIEIEFKLENA